MEKGEFIFVVGLLTYIWSAPTSSETVWLKDVTRRFQTDKRTLSDIDLPNELTFHLKRGSDALTLSLKRNHDINPNADVYFVRKLKDGRFVPVKTRNVKNEAVAYYQDMDNGAFMTIRCVKRSNEHCDRVINGNVRIGDSSYDLQTAENDVISRNVLEVPGLLGKRYVLQHLADTHRVNSVKNKDETRQSKKHYYVEVAVLIDSGIWDLYSSTVQNSNPLKRTELVKEKIREAYSHIMNGVNMRYKESEDTDISIRVQLCSFIFFQRKGLFPHKFSKVTMVKGNTYIEALPYLKDLFVWDKETGVNHLPIFDHAMLFTKYDLYNDSPINNVVQGISFRGWVCVLGSRTSVVEANHYSRTVHTAAHELGHSLGAYHDNEGDATACKADDLFIMTPVVESVDPSKPYTRNPWLFSSCSMDSFKKTLKDKQCVTTEGSIYNMEEWMKYIMKQPGEVYTLNEQCRLINGPKSVNCGTVSAEICQITRCTDSKTDKCLPEYISAAEGTICGEDMWCIEGRCVPRRSNEIADF